MVSVDSKVFSAGSGKTFELKQLVGSRDITKWIKDPLWYHLVPPQLFRGA